MNDEKNRPVVRQARLHQARLRQSGAATAVVNGKIKALELAEHLAVPIRKIVTVHGNGLDELIWTLPALAALRDSFPGARIISVVRPALGAILKETGCVDEVWPRPRGLSAQAPLMARLHACHFDLALAFSTSRDATLLSWSSAASQRAGFQGAQMEVLLTHRVPLHRHGQAARTFPGLHDHLELVREIGCKTHYLDARGLLHPGVEAETKAQKWLDERGIAGDFLVVNAVSESGQRAPWQSALQVLATRRPLVLIGNAPYQPLASTENVFDLGGRADLLVLAALCESARAFIGGEGGWRQLAHAMQTPMVTIDEKHEAENLLSAVNELLGV